MPNLPHDPALKALFITVFLCLLMSIALTIAISGNNALTRFDKHAATTIHNHTRETLDEVFEIITDFGSLGVGVIGLSAATWLFIQKKWLQLGAGIMAIVGGEGLNTLLKALIARQRPVFPHPEIANPHQLSFPSGHAMMSIIAYGFVVYLLWFWLSSRLPNRRARIALALAAALLVLLIGFSRLYLGVHYVSDVAAGYTMGGGWLLLWIGVLRVMENRYRV